MREKEREIDRERERERERASECAPTTNNVFGHGTRTLARPWEVLSIDAE